MTLQEARDSYDRDVKWFGDNINGLRSIYGKKGYVAVANQEVIGYGRTVEKLEDVIIREHGQVSHCIGRLDGRKFPSDPIIDGVVP